MCGMLCPLPSPCQSSCTDGCTDVLSHHLVLSGLPLPACAAVVLLQLNNLFDMQHMWYEVRCGDAHLAAGQLGKALKKYTGVAKHFTDFAGAWGMAASIGVTLQLQCT